MLGAGAFRIPASERVTRLLPGLLLCVAVTLVATLVQTIEVRLTGQPYLEALVLAIVFGVLIRTVWAPGPFWMPGIQFSAKFLLEVAVVLLGASISAAAVLALGLPLIVGIAFVVALAIATSFGICRVLKLPTRMAILIACGNSICGNSAIAAVAPVIGAKPNDIASSIAFTAVLGVAVVLCLPLLVPILQLTLAQYGVLAGLTVYAVPQVLAATLPIGALSNQIGTVVKLVRVLMLGPVVLALSLMARSRFGGMVHGQPAGKRGGMPALHQLIPWFIFGFILFAAIRTTGLIPEYFLKSIRNTATFLTIISMAALGLGVNLRVVARAGARVTIAVTASLVVLGGISLGLIWMIGVG